MAQMKVAEAMAQFCAKLHDAVLDVHGVSVECGWQMLPMEDAVLVKVGDDYYTIHLSTMEWIVTYVS